MSDEGSTRPGRDDARPAQDLRAHPEHRAHAAAPHGPHTPHRNQKLAPLLAGRAVAGVDPPPAAVAPPASPFAPSAATTWRVRLGDGAVLTVRTNGTPPAGTERAATAAVVDVAQQGTTLTLLLAGDPSRALVFHTAEPSACVMLRDAQGRMLYAD